MWGWLKAGGRAAWGGIKAAGRGLKAVGSGIKNTFHNNQNDPGALGVGDVLDTVRDVTRPIARITDDVKSILPGQNPDDPHKRKEYMDTVFPGTTPWERLGSPGGAATVSGGASQAAARTGAQAQRAGHAQREKESLRTVALQMRGQTLQALGPVMQTLVGNDPNNLGPAMQLFRQATGSSTHLPETGSRLAFGDGPWENLNPRETRTRHDLEGELTDARVSSMGTQEKTSLKSVHIAGLRQSLDDWIAKNGRSHIANELRGVAGWLRQGGPDIEVGRFDGADFISGALMAAVTRRFGGLSRGALKILRGMK